MPEANSAQTRPVKVGTVVCCKTHALLQRSGNRPVTIGSLVKYLHTHVQRPPRHLPRFSLVMHGLWVCGGAFWLVASLAVTRRTMFGQIARLAALQRAELGWRGLGSGGVCSRLAS